MVVHYNESQAEELVERQMISRGGRTDTAIRSFEAQLIPRLDGLVFVSEFMRLHLQAQLPEVRKIPSVVIPNFLESKPIISVDERLADCISVGSLVERKNHAYLLRVLASARRAGHRYTLTLVGDGPERSPLQRLAEELGVTDQVSFAGRRHDVDSLLSRHRLYVHSSTMENCPFALIEAFRSGLPVVAAAVGGIPEVIGKDGAGRFWDLADPEAGAQVLSDFLEDRVAMQRAARNARSRFEEAFDAVVVGQRLVQFLDGVRMGRKP
jgi:glycosyltransferase involved in cell wall biosynthesis